MKNFSSRFIYTLLITVAYSSLSNAMEGPKETLPQSTKKNRLNKVDLYCPYPKDWNSLDNETFFNLVTKEETTPQFIVNWCKRMHFLLTSKNKTHPVTKEELAQCIFILGKYGNHPKTKTALMDYFEAYPEFLRFWQSHARPYLNNKEFNKQELISILYTHASLVLDWPNTFRDSLYAEILTHLTTKTRNDWFSKKQLYTIFCSRTVPHHPLPNDVKEAWYAAAIHHIKTQNARQQFTPEELIRILYVHALDGILLPEDFNTALQNLKNQYFKQNKYNLYNLTNIIYSHITLNLPLADDIKEAWQKEIVFNVVNSSHSFSEQHFTNAFYNFARLEMNLPQEFIQPVFTLLRTSNDEQMLRTLYRGLSYFQLTDALAGDLQYKYHQFLAKMKGIKIEKPSTLQQSVKGILKKIFDKDLKEEYWVDELVARVDFFVPSRNLIIEADGPEHFLQGTKHYNTRSFLRDLIVQRSNKSFKTISIPCYEWNELTTPQEKTDYLRNKISTFAPQEINQDVVKAPPKATTKTWAPLPKKDIISFNDLQVVDLIDSMSSVVTENKVVESSKSIMTSSHGVEKPSYSVDKVIPQPRNKAAVKAANQTTTWGPLYKKNVAPSNKRQVVDLMESTTSVVASNHIEESSNSSATPMELKPSANSFTPLSAQLPYTSPVGHNEPFMPMPTYIPSYGPMPTYMLPCMPPYRPMPPHGNPDHYTTPSIIYGPVLYAPLHTMQPMEQPFIPAPHNGTKAPVRRVTASSYQDEF